VPGVRLVLLDSDDTLLWLKGAGLAAVVSAIEAVYGLTIKPGRYSGAGKTDPQIARDLLRRAGVGPEVVDAGLARWMEAMPAALRAVLPAHAVEACPGVRPLLAALAARRGVVLGLLSGALENSVPLRLGAAGLTAHVFRVGAYGSDDADYRELAAIAVQRAEQILDRVLLAEDVVVAGATPAVIAGAHAYGARAVAVATGRYSAAELRRYRPDEILPDLSDLQRVLEVLLAGS
jgi:phosphoglycolate phosphatase-like HAD superfamily hydrolase